MFHKKLTHQLMSGIISLTVILILRSAIMANGDGQCCRKRIQCFECDSRYDSRCGEPFNLTQSSGMMIYCDDLCVKLKHKFNGQFYYIRSCADQFKRIHIKKTDVCYSTRLKDGGHLCFCDQEFCNAATTLNQKLVFKYFNLVFLQSVLFLLFTFSFTL